MSWEYFKGKGLFFALCFLALPVAAGELTPQQLTRQIDTQGPKAVIATLYGQDERQWRVVMEEIGKGDSAWLSVAARLAPGSDADSAESLATAVATAIPYNPAGVLAILDDNALPLSTSEVCGLPFYTLTEPELDHYVVAAIQALYKVAASKACIDTLVNTLRRSDGFNADN